MSIETLKGLMGRFGDVDGVIMCTKKNGRFKNIPIDEAIVFYDCKASYSLITMDS